MLSKKELLKSVIGKSVTIGFYDGGNMTIRTNTTPNFYYKITQVGEDIFEAIDASERKSYLSISHIVLIAIDS